MEMHNATDLAITEITSSTDRTKLRPHLSPDRPTHNEVVSPRLDLAENMSHWQRGLRQVRLRDPRVSSGAGGSELEGGPTSAMEVRSTWWFNSAATQDRCVRRKFRARRVSPKH